MIRERIAFATTVAAVLVATLQAQAPEPPAAASPAAGVAPATAPAMTIMVAVGGSTVVKTDFPITRFALNNPTVADATLVDPKQLLVDGKSAGSVSLIVWGDGQKLQQYEIAVYPPTPPLQKQFKLLFPNEDIQVTVADEAIVLSGKVASNAVALRAVEIAEKSSSKSKVINMLELPGGGEQQVMLQVRVAEVARRAVSELGATFFTGSSGYNDWVGRVSTQQFAAPGFVERIGPPPPTDPNREGKLTFTDFLNLFVFNTKYDVGAVIAALRARGFFQSLAEPTLIAYNGQEASFLAGGEVPVPIAQGLTGAVTVTFKEFGVRLTFRPTVAGDVIRLKVKPEVSALDFANGITLQGFRIPALLTRRAETDVELRDGQSFAIGGLMNNMTQTDRAGIPGLSDVPIIGNLFKSRAERKEQTELVVIITPHLVRPLNATETPHLPTLPDRFLRPEEKQKIDGTPPAPRSGADDAAQAPLPATPVSKFCVAFWCW